MPKPRRTIGFKGVNTPVPIAVQENASHAPVAVTLKGRALSVESVMDRWAIDDEWWRDEAISRMYYQLVVENGRVVIVYSEIDGSWYQQNAG